MTSNWQKSQVRRFFGCCPADSQADEEQNQLPESTPTTLDSLPDEILMRIIHLAVKEVDEETEEWDFKYLVEVISKVSIRFRKIAFDP